MGFVGAGSLVIYSIFALYVYCTVHEENTLTLMNEDDLSNRHNSDKKEKVGVNVDTIQRIFQMEDSDHEGHGLLAKASDVFTNRTNVLGFGRHKGGFNEESKKASSGSAHGSEGGHNDSFIADMKKHR